MENKKQRQCYFCRANIMSVDPKDTQILKRYLSSYGKIVPRRRSGACAWHQRKLSNSIKRSRIVGLLPFVVQ